VVVVVEVVAPFASILALEEGAVVVAVSAYNSFQACVNCCLAVLFVEEVLY
jgi:hypothetical protein